jgi:hypothetical protein
MTDRTIQLFAIESRASIVLGSEPTKISNKIPKKSLTSGPAEPGTFRRHGDDEGVAMFYLFAADDNAHAGVEMPRATRRACPRPMLMNFTTFLRGDEKVAHCLFWRRPHDDMSRQTALLASRHHFIGAVHLSRPARRNCKMQGELRVSHRDNVPTSAGSRERARWFTMHSREHQ